MDVENRNYIDRRTSKSTCNDGMASTEGRQVYGTIDNGNVNSRAGNMKTVQRACLWQKTCTMNVQKREPGMV